MRLISLTTKLQKQYADSNHEAHLAWADEEETLLLGDLKWLGESLIVLRGLGVGKSGNAPMIRGTA